MPLQLIGKIILKQNKFSNRHSMIFGRCLKHFPYQFHSKWLPDDKFTGNQLQIWISLWKLVLEYLYCNVARRSSFVKNMRWKTCETVPLMGASHQIRSACMKEYHWIDFYEETCHSTSKRLKDVALILL